MYLNQNEERLEKVGKQWWCRDVAKKDENFTVKTQRFEVMQLKEEVFVMY